MLRFSNFPDTFNIITAQQYFVMRTMEQNDKKKDINLEQLGVSIRSRVNKEKLILTKIFREEAEKLETEQDILSLALAASPEGRLDQAIIIIYNAFEMKPEELEYQIAHMMSGRDWDRLSLMKLNIVEDLLGLKRDSLYSIFRKD